VRIAADGRRVALGFADGSEVAADAVIGADGVHSLVREHVGFSDRPHFTGRLTTARPGHPLWTWPLNWPGAPHPKLGDGKPSLIFCGDMSDVFHEDRPEEIIDRVIGTLALADRHIFLLLTKRTARMAAYFSKQSPRELRRWRRNMWLGFSAEGKKGI
jgi:2-polyprenyl-6-methoxyphenol hydroxylase-like FAD-dependent oxidoreductase